MGFPTFIMLMCMSFLVVGLLLLLPVDCCECDCLLSLLDDLLLDLLYDCLLLFWGGIVLWGTVFRSSAEVHDMAFISTVITILP